MLIRFIFLFVFFGSASCSPDIPLLSRKNNTDITSQEEFIYSNNKKNNKKLDGKNIKIDHRLKKILLSPSLISNKKNIEAAKKTVLIVQSQTEPIITAISNVGPKLDNDELELDATGGLSVTKVISDGGALSAMTNSAELNVRASELLYAQNINNELMEIIKAEQAIINFRKIELIYNEQFSL